MITEETFQEKVVNRSFQVPVVLDFWAEWCGPCRTLGPILDKLVKDYKGSFDLVKINTEENRELAMMFKISSIPDVRIIRNGKLVDHFLGAIPEKEIRKILDKHITKPSESEDDLDEDSWEGIVAKNPIKILEKLANTEPKNIPPQRDEFVWKAYVSLVKKNGSIEDLKKIVEAIEEENTSFCNQRRVTLPFLEKVETALQDLRSLLKEDSKVFILDKYLNLVSKASSDNKSKVKDDLLACFYLLPPGDKDVIEYQKKLSRLIF